MSRKGSDCTGGSGEDMTLTVPVGTTIVDRDTDEVLADLAETKNKFELPISKQASNKMPDWDSQLTEWKASLISASQNFQSGVASVLPAKNACDYCDYDLLCRIDKSSNNR